MHHNTAAESNVTLKRESWRRLMAVAVIGCRAVGMESLTLKVGGRFFLRSNFSVKTEP